MRWNSAHTAASSWASWIATKPLVALILLLALLLGAALASNRYTKGRMLVERERVLRQQAEDFEARIVEETERYNAALAPVTRERDRLKRRLANLGKAREEIVPPRDENEIVSRFRELGY